MKKSKKKAIKKNIFKKIIVTLILTITIFFNNVYSQNKKEIKSTVTINGFRIFIEISDSKETRKQGLMWRNQLDKNAGMLFIYQDSAVRYFWMKNTFVTLDMAFIDSNMVIKTIHTAKAVNDSTTFYSSYVPVKYVLEVNSGWFEEHGIHPGDKVIFSIKNFLREED